MVVAVVEIVDVATANVDVVATAAVGEGMRGASVACDDAALLPPHAANDSSAAIGQARQRAREE